MPPVETYIAKRYLVSRRRLRFINIIGIISVTGITIGVAALLIVLSVFNGFNGLVKDVLVGFDPHIRVEKKGGLARADEERIEGLLAPLAHVKASSPFVSGKAMLVARHFNHVVFIRGVDPERIGGVSGLREKIVLGSASFSDSTSSGGIVIGLALADRLSAVVGDEIVVMSPYSFQNALSGLSGPLTMKFQIKGIYESNNKDYDANYAYIGLSQAQRLFNTPGGYSGVEMRLDDLENAEAVKEALERSPLARDLVISTWYDLHRSLYTVMRIERWSAYILLSLIIVVATFNMLGSLTMGVIEKQRDIGVLRSMGMGPRGITRIFMFEGLLIGLIGTVAGFVIGLVVLYLQIAYQIFPLDTTVYIIPAIPVRIEWADFLSVAGASMGLTFLASYYPARRAGLTLPAESIRWE